MSRGIDRPPTDFEAPAPEDAETVALQLARQPRGPWRVAVRCRFGYPQVIETAPILDDGQPFPTLYYLTCPWIAEGASDLESSGEVARVAALLAADPDLAARVRAADAEYRARRARAAGGVDPTPDVGIAGQRDPLATKCLHAHVASALAGIDDPVGLQLLDTLGSECADIICLDPAGEPLT